MEYRKKDLDTFQLHMIKVDKFKSIKMRLFFRTPVVKEEITERNCLNQVLTLSCEKYKTHRELAIKKQELYAPSVTTMNRRIGNYLSTQFTFTMLEEKYTEPGMMEESIAFFADMLFHPNVENRAFDKETVKIIKREMEDSIKGLKENSAKYSLIRLTEEMGDGPYSYRSFGYLEDLERVTEESLYESYQKMIKTNLVDIYVIGNFDFDEMEELIKKYFKFYTLKKKRIACRITHEEGHRKMVEVKEDDDIQQAKLAIGIKLIDLTEDEWRYAVTLYNLILGGNTDSKLFQVVREKNSLAYSVHSSITKADNLLLINCGIDKANYDKALRLIKEAIDSMAKGDFDEVEINKAKETYYTSLDGISDSEGALIDNYYMMELLGTEDMETKREKIKATTKEEIVAVAKKIKIDTVFLLEGKGEEK